MAYIVTNNSLVGQVADDDPALDDPSIEYPVQEVNLSNFDFDSWFQSLPEGTKVVKRSGYFEWAKDQDGDFLEEGDEGYFEPYFVPYTNRVVVR